MPADAQIDPAASARQLVGDLLAGGAAPTTSTAPGGDWSGLR
jgi:hypothetical protein